MPLIAAAGAAYSIHGTTPDNPTAEAPGNTATPSCEVAGATTVVLPEKAPTEPSIDAPLAPGWGHRGLQPRRQRSPLRLTVIDGKDDTRWIAFANIATTQPDDPAYIAQRDALVKGLHASAP